MAHDETPLDTLRVYSSAELADLLGVTRSTVHRWIISGRLDAHNIGAPDGRPRLRITEAGLRAFLEANRFEGSTA